MAIEVLEKRIIILLIKIFWWKENVLSFVDVHEAEEVCNYDKKIIFLREILKRLFCNENFIGGLAFEYNFIEK